MNMSEIQLSGFNILLILCLLLCCGNIAQLVWNKEVYNPQKKIIELSSAYILSRSIHVAASMKLADYFIEKPYSIDKLADKINVNSDALYRLFRLLASHNIFYESEHRVFSITPLAELLTSAHPESLQAWLAFHDGDENRWRSYGNMEYSIRTGEPVFNHLFGSGFFDVLAKDPTKSEAFDEGMRNISEKEELEISSSFDFSHYANIMDIGGGKGGLLKAIIQNNPVIHGILFDLPHAQIPAELYLAENGLADRVSFEPGSFFDEISSGSDLYILKRILHDWDDQQCIKILANCRKAMKKHTKLLIIEAIVEPGNKSNIIKEIDLAMLLLFGGKERTQNEWDLLLHAAGLQCVSVHKTSSMLSILEVIQK